MTPALKQPQAQTIIPVPTEEEYDALLTEQVTSLIELCQAEKSGIGYSEALTRHKQINARVLSAQSAINRADMAEYLATFTETPND